MASFNPTSLPLPLLSSASSPPPLRIPPLSNPSPFGHTLSQTSPVSASLPQPIDPDLLSLSSSNSSSSRLIVKRTVSVFWDLDNKPPKVSPYDAALRLRDTAAKFGDVVDMVAYANRHAFLHIPQWVREERQGRKELDQLERKGVVKPESPYICGMCGRKCKTNLDLKKHFKQLHERERQKRMSRLHSLKGKKKTKFKERIHPKDERYKDAARTLLVPKVGYGLATELKRAGVFVQRVEDKPQAADRALKKQMVSSINRGIKCLCLVSDDSDFSTLLTTARAKRLRTIVIGDTKSLQRFADIWFPWENVAQGLAHGEILEAVSQLSAEGELMQELSDDNSDPDISRFDLFRGLESHPQYMGKSIMPQAQFFSVINSDPVVKVSAFSEEEENLYDSEEDFDYDLGEISEEEWVSDDETWEEEEE